MVSLVSQSNIQNEEETCFDSKAIPTFHIESISHHPTEAVQTTLDVQTQDLEMKATDWSLHPSEHLQPNQISLEDGEANIVPTDIINILTDGSKTEHGVGAGFCVLTNDSWAC
ncbi:hypothetical protein AVEN_241370-1 [Araneus ventricosus]|uniref:RNase H type-1 domain-containing protein n=1 Tax=Araneus ventricosus TaxID=182803 RepID=A0A4Y2HLB9_ARAVE|nr:hypothetical protein AVEN_241370-1 [Araneus ventricosus]